MEYIKIREKTLERLNDHRPFNRSISDFIDDLLDCYQGCGDPVPTGSPEHYAMDE